MLSAWGPAGTIIRHKYGWDGYGMACALIERVGAAAWSLDGLATLAADTCPKDGIRAINVLQALLSTAELENTDGMVRRATPMSEIEQQNLSTGACSPASAFGRLGARARWGKRIAASGAAMDAAIICGHNSNGNNLGQKLEIPSGSTYLDVPNAIDAAMMRPSDAAIGCGHDAAIKEEGGRGGGVISACTSTVQEPGSIQPNPITTNSSTPQQPVPGSTTVKQEKALTKAQLVKALKTLPFPINFETTEVRKAWTDWIDYQAQPGRSKFLYRRPMDAVRVLAKWQDAGADRFIRALEYSIGCCWQSALIREPDQAGGQATVWEKNLQGIKKLQAQYDKEEK